MKTNEDGTRTTTAGDAWLDRFMDRDRDIWDQFVSDNVYSALDYDFREWEPEQFMLFFNGGVHHGNIEFTERFYDSASEDDDVFYVEDLFGLYMRGPGELISQKEDLAVANGNMGVEDVLRETVLLAAQEESPTVGLGAETGERVAKLSALASNDWRVYAAPKSSVVKAH